MRPVNVPTAMWKNPRRELTRAAHCRSRDGPDVARCQDGVLQEGPWQSTPRDVRCCRPTSHV